MNSGVLVFIHGRLAQSVWIFMLAMGAWALVHYIRNRPLDGNFFGIVVVGEILLIAQAVLGGLMALQGLVPGNPFLHYLYGVFGLLVLPAIYFYTGGDQNRRAALLWTFAGVFMWGLSLRLITLGLGSG